MKILVDTHCLLWMIAEPKRFGAKTQRLLEAEDTVCWLSTASLFEISIKYSLKKLTLPEPPREYLPPLLDRMGILELAVNRHHAYRVADLPWHHRDPFDRLLLAQSIIEKMPLLTGDEQLFRYRIRTVDARE